MARSTAFSRMVMRCVSSSASTSSISGFSITSAFAAGAPAGAAGPESVWLQFVPLLVIFAIFYFLLIRPQMKKAKEQRQLIASVAKGDEVVTQGGVIGKITKMGDTFVNVEVANNVELQVQRVAIIQVLPKGSYSK